MPSTTQQPDQRTHSLLRSLGIRCGKVERFIGKQRSDLFGFIDQVAMNPTGLYPLPAGLIGIQSTGGDSNGNGNARVEKIRSELLWPAAQDWLDCDCELFVFNWVRLDRGGRTLYSPRIFQILDQDSPVEWREI